MPILFSVLFFLVSFFTANGFSEIEDQGGWNKWGLRARAPPLFEEGFKKGPYYYLTSSANPEDDDQSKGTKNQCVLSFLSENTILLSYIPIIIFFKKRETSVKKLLILGFSLWNVD